MVGITVGQFANARWRDRTERQAGKDEVAGLYRIATLTADGADLLSVVEGVQREVANVLYLASCRYEVDPSDRGLPEMEPTGRVDAPYVHLEHGFALPRAGFTIPVRANGRSLGALVCEPATPEVGVSIDRRHTAIVLADHLALALANGTPRGRLSHVEVFGTRPEPRPGRQNPARVTSGSSGPGSSRVRAPGSSHVRAFRTRLKSGPGFQCPVTPGLDDPDRASLAARSAADDVTPRRARAGEGGASPAVSGARSRACQRMRRAGGSGPGTGRWCVRYRASLGGWSATTELLRQRQLWEWS